MKQKQLGVIHRRQHVGHHWDVIGVHVFLSLWLINSGEETAPSIARMSASWSALWLTFLYTDDELNNWPLRGNYYYSTTTSFGNFYILQDLWHYRIYYGATTTYYSVFPTVQLTTSTILATIPLVNAQPAEKVMTIHTKVHIHTPRIIIA